MKKTLACLLAALMALMCLAPIAFAEDAYTISHCVKLENSTAFKVELVDLTEDNLLTDDDGNTAVADPSGYVTNGYYIAHGNTAVIALRTIDTYTFDITSRVKVYPASMNVDIINGVEYENSAYGTILNLRVLCNDEGQPIDEFGNKLDVREVDKQGYDRWEGADKRNLIYIGTFNEVTEDIFVKVYNVEDENIGGVRDFLFSMFKFFENLIRWFFALTPFKK